MTSTCTTSESVSKAQLWLFVDLPALIIVPTSALST